MKGQAISGLIIGIGSGIVTVIFAWNSWLSVNLFADHANLASVSTGVTDIRDSVDNQIIPTMNAMADQLKVPVQERKTFFITNNNPIVTASATPL